MSDPCAHCGSTACVRNGRESVRLAFLEGGRVSHRESPVTRTRCRDCGRSGRTYDPAHVAAEAVVREHVVERFFHLGQEGAANETGLPSSTVYRHFQAWSAPREDDVAAAEPDSLLLEPARLRNVDSLLVIDMERATLVEVLAGTDALAAWLDAPTRPPALEACVPLDPAVVAVLRARVPSTRLMVAPSAVAKAARATAMLSLRTLRRRPDMAGRNGMPTVAEFVAAIDVGRPGEGWPGEAAALLGATRLALDLCAGPTRLRTDGLWPEFALAASDRSCRSLSTLMHAWRECLGEGLGRADVEAVSGTAQRVRHGLALRRPALGYAGLRAYALLRDFERLSESSPVPGRPRLPVSVGACLDALARRLAA